MCFYYLHRQSNITAKVWCAKISGNETTPPQTERQSSFFLFMLPLAGNLAPLSWPIRRKVTCSRIPALYVCYKHLLRFLIGSIDWHRQLWLARLNAFILILEKHSDKTRLTGFHTIYNNNLGKNRDEATRKPRRAILPFSLIWGGGGSKFVIYFVQYCTELHTESPHDCIIINNHEPGFVSGSGVRGGFINDGL